MKNDYFRKGFVFGIIMLLMWIYLVPIFIPLVKANGNDSLSQSYFWQGHGGYVHIHL